MTFVATGGSGFLGRALLRVLLRRGHAVRTVVRRSEAAHELQSLGAQVHQADLRRPESCRGAVAAGDVIIHAAAHVELRGGWPPFERDTVRATHAFLNTALPENPVRFIYVSSGGVYGATATPGGWCADHAPARPAPYNHYGRAKLQAERLVRAACERAGVPWVILRLGCLYGPGHHNLVESVQRLAQRRRLLLIGDGSNRIATLYVDDAVEALLLAAVHPAACNRTYDVASTERVTQQQYVGALTDLAGVSPPRLHVHRGVALAVVAAVESVGVALGAPPLVSRMMVDLIGLDHRLDTSAIRSELGWKPKVTFLEGMRRMRDWQRDQRVRPAISRFPTARRSAPAVIASA
jgi:nucleoside-diphosphate-sugar epimerase